MKYYVTSVDLRFDPAKLKMIVPRPYEDYVEAWVYAGKLYEATRAAIATTFDDEPIDEKNPKHLAWIVIDEPTANLSGLLNAK